MSTQNDPKADLLVKTADFYRRSIANYVKLTTPQQNPPTKKPLQQRLQTILKEIDSLGVKPVSAD
jgi:hypothetical protein